MRKVSGRRRKGNHKTHFVFNNFFGGKYFVIYEVMWKNIVELGRLQTTIWWVRTARWIHKVTEYVIMIFFYGNNSCTNEPKYYVIHVEQALFSLQPNPGQGYLVVDVSRSNTFRQTHIHACARARGSTSLKEGSARRRCRCLHNTQQTQRKKYPNSQRYSNRQSQ
jgi:hypothetical protein